MLDSSFLRASGAVKAFIHIVYTKACKQDRAVFQLTFIIISQCCLYEFKTSFQTLPAIILKITGSRKTKILHCTQPCSGMLYSEEHQTKNLFQSPFQTFFLNPFESEVPEFKNDKS